MTIFAKRGIFCEARKLSIVAEKEEEVCSLYLWRWASPEAWRDCGIALCLLGYEFSLQYEEPRNL